MLLLRPPARDAFAAIFGLRFAFEFFVERFVVVVETKSNDHFLRKRRIGVTMKTTSRRCRQFCKNIRLVQKNRIIIRKSRLIFFLKRKRISIFLRHRRINLVFAHGQKQQIAIIAHARSAQMRVRETQNFVIRIVIPSASVPTFGARIGRQLNHAERNRRAWKRMSMPPVPIKGLTWRVKKSAFGRSGVCCCCANKLPLPIK